MSIAGRLSGADRPQPWRAPQRPPTARLRPLDGGELDPRRSNMRAKLGAPPCRKSAAIAIGMSSETFAAAALSWRSKASTARSAPLS